MTFVAENVDPAGLERKGPTEAADIDEITHGMLALQARVAASAKRPLARGTHAKGICVRAEFEVFDIRRLSRDPAQAERLAQGIFAVPGVYPAICVSPMPTAAIAATAGPTSGPCRSRSRYRLAFSLAPRGSIFR